MSRHIKPFTLDDVDAYLAEQLGIQLTKLKVEAQAKPIPVQAPRVIAAASILDILGTTFKPTVAPKYKKYLELLQELEYALDTSHAKELTQENSGDACDYVSDELSLYEASTADKLNNITRQEIADAISRIYKGTYGICVTTGQPIEEERLLTLPYTKYSKQGASLCLR